MVGFGRRSVHQLGCSEDRPWRLDLSAVETALKKPRTASIVAVSAGDVNTGGYALESVEEWTRLREVADRYGAWIHVDGGEPLN